MSKKLKAHAYIVFVVLMIGVLACSCTESQQPNYGATLFAQSMTSAAESETQSAALSTLAAIPTLPTIPLIPTLTPDAAPAPTEEPANPISQWAQNATASSQWSDESGAAIEAAGEPDSAECVDQHSAWASVGSNEVATLTLEYETPVIPTQINIYQVWHPDAVSQVDVIDINGEMHSVYTAEPTLLPDGTYPCPYILTIDVSNISVPISQVVVTIDQTTFNDWNEIDAVELVGIPE